MASSQMRNDVTRFGVVGMERLQGTLVPLAWLMMRMQGFACGRIRFLGVKFLVRKINLNCYKLN
jgi:hypothetical protein